MSDIFDEIDQALKQEKLEKWWKENGKMVLWFCFCLVFFTGVITFGKNWMEKTKAEQTGTLIQLVEKGEGAGLNAADIKIPEGATPDEISKMLNEQAAKAPSLADGLLGYADEAPEGLAMVARFRAAQAAFTKGDMDKAYEILNALHADSSLDRIYRDYALLVMTLKKAENEKADKPALIESLAPLADKDNPWRSSALEARAVLYASLGENEKAVTDLKAILDSDGTPEARRERAEKFAHVLRLRQSGAVKE